MDRFTTLREIMALTFEVDEATITAETAQATCPKWDSLGHLNLMLAVEDAFGVRLSVDDIPRLTSVPAILAHLRALASA